MSESTPIVTPTKAQLIKQAVERKGKLNVQRGTITPPTEPATKPAAKHKGARKVTESLTPTQLKEEIKDLLQDLKDSTDAEEKKKIRRKLRIRGHFGGLGATTKPELKAKAA